MGDIDEVLAGSRRWCVVEGDCLQIMPTIATQAIHHTITDPPYGEEFHKKARTQGNDGSERDVDYGFAGISEAERAAVAEQIERLTQRWALVFSDPETAHAWRDALTGRGMRYVRKGIWIKEGCTPQFTGDRPASGHEEISIAYASLSRTPGRTRWNGGGARGVWVHPIVRNVDEGREHTTPKPPALMQELLTLFTDRDELVLDPFGGSGTTGVAALRTGRRVILIERQAKYAQLIRERLSAEEHMSTISASRSKQEPLF